MANYTMENQTSEQWAVYYMNWQHLSDHILTKQFKAILNCKNIGVFELIKNKEPDPLPEDVDPRIKELISLLLVKNPEKRLSIFELADRPIIKEKIKKFAEDYNCKEAIEQVLSIFQKSVTNSPKKTSISASNMSNIIQETPENEDDEKKEKPKEEEKTEKFKKTSI